MDPLSCTAPDTPWATLILSASLWEEANNGQGHNDETLADQGKGEAVGLPVSPEIAILAAKMLVHGIKRTHATVFLQPDPIREEVFTRGFSGGSQ